MKIIPIMEARKQLTSLPETLTRDDKLDVAEITRYGKPVLAVLPWTLYEALAETLEVMGDQELMTQLRQSIKEMEAGEVLPWEEARRELGV